MSQLKFLYFDLGNVMLPFEYSIAVRQMADVAGVTPALIQQVVFDGDLQLACERGDITSAQFYEAFCQRTGRRPDFEALTVASSDMFRLDEAVVGLILQLRRSGYRTGVLSNTCEAHWQFCRDRKFPILQQLFEVAALSYELRAMKPDLAIYRGAAELAGVAPGEIFFVDDRPEHVAGACQAGFDAVLFIGADKLAAALADRGVRPRSQPG